MQRSRAITKEARRIEMTTKALMVESMQVLRFGSAEIGQHRDGVALTKAMLVIPAWLGFVDPTAFPVLGSRATLGQIKDFNAVTEGNTRGQQILACRAYARVGLAGIAQDLVMHPNQQALQTSPKVARQYDAIHSLLGAPALEVGLTMR